MKENKSNELKKGDLEQVAGGGGSPAVQRLTEEINAMTTKAMDMVKKSREGFANGTVSEQEASDVLLEVGKMYEIIEKKAKQRASMYFTPES